MTLDQLLNQEQQYTKRENLVDTLGKITYSLFIGTGVDYFQAGLRGLEIVAARGTATAINTVTGTPYARWRREWYKFTNTSEESSRVRKSLVELAAFNTFETYTYGICAGIGSIVSSGTVDFEKITDGIAGLFYLSPFIGPTVGWWLNLTCRALRVRTVAERASET